MATLVLDKSVLWSASTQSLMGLRARHEFLLTTTLLQELGTEDLIERLSIDKSTRARLDKRVEALFQRAVEVGDNQWLDHIEALKWEITEGRSAKDAPRIEVRGALDIHRILDDKTLQDCLSFDSAKASFASFSAPVRNEDDRRVIAALKLIPEEDFFCRLAHGLGLAKSPAEVRATISVLATEGEKRYGWKRSSHFFPRKDWFIYGIALSHMAYLPWKLWKHGNDRLSKAANAAYDLYYIGFIAIADGLISLDKTMLKLAWAMWPDKRSNIYEYHDGKAVVFTPVWSTTSGAVNPEEPLPFL